MPSVEWVDWARTQGELLLAPLGARWLHTLAVAEQANRLRPMFNEPDGERLVAAAYLHDVGYAPQLIVTRFHPLDGAIWLAGLIDDEVCALVAHHSCAWVEANFRGLIGELEDLPKPRWSLLDGLTYCDMTSGPDGRRVDVEERLVEIRSRYGPEHVVTVAVQFAANQLRDAVARVQADALAAGIVLQPR